jgi:hypothetical protein
MEKNNCLLIRVDESKKIDFKVAILRQRVSMQKVLESFIDALVAYDRGEKNPMIDRILKKSQ